MINILENTISTKFKDISEHKMKLLMAILSDESVRKWVAYLTENPEEEKSVSIDTVLKENVVNSKINEDILQEDKILLFIELLEGDFNFNALSTEHWVVNIILPNEYWFIKQYAKERIYEIAYRIARAIDNQRLIGIGKVEIKGYKQEQMNRHWTGLSLFVEAVYGYIPEVE